MYLVQYYCPAEGNVWKSPRNNRRLAEFSAALLLAESLCPARGGGRVLDLDEREVYLCVGPLFRGSLPV